MLDKMRTGTLLVVEVAAGKGTGRAPLDRSHCVAYSVKFLRGWALPSRDPYTRRGRPQAGRAVGDDGVRSVDLVADLNTSSGLPWTSISIDIFTNPLPCRSMTAALPAV
jgi:hypothetical protein